MADQADRSERTEEATPKKIEDALKKGQTPFSRETPTFASLLGLLVIFGIIAAERTGAFVGFLAQLHDKAGEVNLTAGADASSLFIEVYRASALFVIPIVILLAIFGVIAAVAQTPPRVVAERVRPKLERISLNAGLRRIFGSQGLADFLRSLFKFVMVGAVAFFTLSAELPAVIRAAFVDPHLLPEQVLVYGDCAVNPDPDAEQLAEIARQSAASAKAFGITPRVAMLSYSTGDSGTGNDVEKVREATRLAREANPDLNIDLRLAGGPVDLLADGCDVAIRRADYGISDHYITTHLWAEYAGPVCDPECWNSILVQDLSNARWLHSRTRPDAWDDWKRASGIDATPASEQYFDHFFFALQAAVNRLGTAIGPLPLVADDLAAGRLIAPHGMAPTGYDYVLITLDPPKRDPRIARFFDWLTSKAGDMELEMKSD